MATATKSKPKRSSPAAEALAFAEKAATTMSHWAELHNALFGESGKCTTLFPTPEARQAFLNSSEGKAVWALIHAAKVAGETPPTSVSGKLLIRLPKSLHAALIQEAEVEGTSVNQLVVAKLSSELRSVLLTKSN